MKRIVIVAPSLTNGGAERMAAMWAVGFSKRGYRVWIVLTNPPSPITYKVPDSVEIINCSPIVGTNRFINSFQSRFLSVHKLRIVLKDIKPNVIISVLRIKLVVKACKGLDCKIVATEHNTFEVPEGAPAIPKTLIKEKYYYNAKADAVTVLSTADKLCIGKRLSNVFVLPNVLAFEPIQELPPKKQIIVAVGRLDGWYVKGFDVLIRAWSIIYNKFPNWKLQIVGNCLDDSLSYLKNLANESNISGQIDFLPFRSDIQSVYRDAEVFCFSSRYDGFGLALIEAMSQGCACVTCDYNGRQKEIVCNEENAIICQQGDVEQLAQALSLVLSDDELRMRLQQNAPKRAAYYSLERIMEKWDEILCSIEK